MSRLPSRNDGIAVSAVMPVISGAFSAASLAYKILSSLYINGKAGHVMEEFRLGLRPEYEAAPPLQTLRSNLLVLEAQANRLPGARISYLGKLVYISWWPLILFPHPIPCCLLEEQRAWLQDHGVRSSAYHCCPLVHLFMACTIL